MTCQVYLKVGGTIPQPPAIHALKMAVHGEKRAIRSKMGFGAMGYPIFFVYLYS